MTRRLMTVSGILRSGFANHHCVEDAGTASGTFWLDSSADLVENAATHRVDPSTGSGQGEYTTIGRATLSFNGTTYDSSDVTGHSETTTPTSETIVDYRSAQRSSGTAGGGGTVDFTLTNRGTRVSGSRSGFVSATALSASQVVGTFKDTSDPANPVTVPIRDNTAGSYTITVTDAGGFSTATGEFSESPEKAMTGSVQGHARVTQEFNSQASNYAGVAGPIDDLPELPAPIFVPASHGGYSLTKSHSTRTIVEEFDYTEIDGSRTRRGTLSDTSTSTTDTREKLPTITQTDTGSSSSYTAQSDSGSVVTGGYTGVFVEDPLGASTASGRSDGSQEVFGNGTARFTQSTAGQGQNRSNTTGTQSSSSKAKFEGNSTGQTGPDGASTGRGTFAGDTQFRTANSGSSYETSESTVQDGLATITTVTIAGGSGFELGDGTDGSDGTTRDGGKGSSGNVRSSTGASQGGNGFLKRIATTTVTPGLPAEYQRTVVTTTSRADDQGKNMGSASGTAGTSAAGQTLNLGFSASPSSGHTLRTTQTTHYTRGTGADGSDTESSLTSVTRTDTGDQKGHAGGTIQSEGDEDSQTENGTGGGDKTSAADVVFEHMGSGRQTAFGAPRYIYEAASGTLSSKDTAAFDAVFADDRDSNYERAHAVVGHDSNETSTATSGWESGSLGASGGWRGQTATRTVTTTGKSGGEATLEDGRPVENAESPNGSAPSGRSEVATTVRDWDYDLSQPNLDYKNYDKTWTSTLTDTIETPANDSQEGDPPGPINTNVQTIEWTETTKSRGPVNSLGSSIGAPFWLTYFDLTSFPITQTLNNTETAKQTQTLKSTDDHQSVTVDRTHTKDFKTRTWRDWDDEVYDVPATMEDSWYWGQGMDSRFQTSSANDTYFYHSEHDVNENGLAYNGSFTATDVRHSESATGSFYEWEGEFFYDAHLGKEPGHYIGTSFRSSVSKSDDNIEEGGTYKDVGFDSQGQPIRESRGHATRTLTVTSPLPDTPSKIVSYTYAGENSTHFLEQPGEYKTVETDLTDTKSSILVLHTTLNYNPRLELSTVGTSITQKSDRVEHTVEDLTGLYNKHGEKTDEDHSEVTFPEKGLPTGVEWGRIRGEQTDADNNGFADIWNQYAFPTFDVADPAEHNPLSGLTFVPRAPTEHLGPPGSTTPAVIGAGIAAQQATLKPVPPPPAPEPPLVVHSRPRHASLLNQTADAGLLGRNKEFAGKVLPVLETTQAVLAETLGSQIMAGSRIYFGHDILSGQSVSAGARWGEAALIAAPFGIGYVAGKGGPLVQRLLFVGEEAADVAGDAARAESAAVRAALPKLAEAPGLQPYQVGTFDKLQDLSEVGDDLAIHHAGQKHPMGQIIPGYDPTTAPAIALPTSEHRAIPNLTGTFAGTARDVLARDIRNLRNYTSAPRESLRALIDLNKEMFPGAFAK